MSGATSADDDGADSPAVDLAEPLSLEEDNELRRLNYLSQNGTLSPRSVARMLELRGRDRRQTIRPPREFETFSPQSPPRRWSAIFKRPSNR